MKFICDTMLGKLAKYLRILGLDARNAGAAEYLQCHEEMADLPYFLTRSTKTIRGKRVVHIKSDRARDQVKEIREIICPCIDPGKIMKRCIECNTELMDVEKEDIEPQVPEFVYHHYARFRKCSQCGKIYWEGSHTRGMAQLVRDVMSPEGRKTGENGE